MKSLYSEPFGDLDAAASSQQVPGVYQPSAMKDAISFKDIDEGHGGVNQTVWPADGAAGSTTMSTHSSSAPTPADLGIS